MLKRVIDACENCLKYNKHPLRPVVGLSTARVFNETKAMDLKEWTKRYSNTCLLHLIEHSSRYKASAVIKSKKKEIILEKFFKIWIKFFWNPNKILVDNGSKLLLQKVSGEMGRSKNIMV